MCYVCLSPFLQLAATDHVRAVFLPREESNGRIWPLGDGGGKFHHDLSGCSWRPRDREGTSMAREVWNLYASGQLQTRLYIDQWIVKLSLTQSRTADSAGSEIVLVHPTDIVLVHSGSAEAVPPQKKSLSLGLADCLQANSVHTTVSANVGGSALALRQSVDWVSHSNCAAGIDTDFVMFNAELSPKAGTEILNKQHRPCHQWISLSLSLSLSLSSVMYI